MKKIVAVIVMLLVVLNLASCKSAGENSNMSGNSAESFVKDTEEQRLAFGKALWDIYQRGILPDGKELDYISMETATGNSFALTDIDGDGKEELLLRWTKASMAGSVEYIFGYDNGTIYVELSEYPELRFYDNGIIEADWSHNQGLAGNFWPYNAFGYDEENDIYQSIGSVDAWDKSVREENYEGEPFPTDIDVDGDGIVYYLLPPNRDGWYKETPLVDGTEYVNWREDYLDGAKEMDIPYQELTEENIATLGYPKPDIQILEPQG